MTALAFILDHLYDSEAVDSADVAHVTAPTRSS